MARAKTYGFDFCIQFQPVLATGKKWGCVKAPGLAFKLEINLCYLCSTCQLFITETMTISIVRSYNQVRTKLPLHAQCYSNVTHSSRPIPDILNPPKGACGTTMWYALILNAKSCLCGFIFQHHCNSSTHVLLTYNKCKGYLHARVINDHVR